VTIVEDMLADGHRLFKSRGRVPLVLLPVAILALPESSRMSARLGGSGSLALQWLSQAVAFAGLLVRGATVAYAPDGTSSRDTRALRAASLNTTGVYSIVRHPLYLGAGLMWIGIAMSLGVWWLVAIVALTYVVYVERLTIVEEAFLAERFPVEFPRWAARTRAFLPRPSDWIPPTGSLQFKRLSSEHNGLLTIGLAFPLLQYLANRLRDGRSWHDWSAFHGGLVILLETTVAISFLCILVRRLPRAPTAAHDGNAQATADPVREPGARP
jgi:protein-S-isoprenylcysteine O-methyltransferase Ste14